MIQSFCPSCGMPLPVAGCSECGEVLFCLFCGWPEQAQQEVPAEEPDRVVTVHGDVCGSGYVA